MIQRQADDLGAHVIAIGGIVGHVHVLARFPSTLAIAELVRRMKGGSSYLGHSGDRQALQVAGFLWRSPCRNAVWTGCGITY
jgi:REP element-mobilizing transposase RayT